MNININNYTPRSGRIIKEDGSIINEADILQGILETVDTIKGKLLVTGNIAANTTFTTNASGINFTKSGASVYLGDTDVEFNDNEKIKVFLNGVLQEKGIDIIFVTSYSFYIINALENTDTIILIKGI